MQELRRERRMAQKQLAGLLHLDQSYLSRIESGRQGAPTVTFVRRIKEVLDLSQVEAEVLQRAASLSRRKIEIPACAAPDEYEFIHELVACVGHLTPAHLRAMKCIMKIHEHTVDGR